jgi:hypothetical protein
MRTISSGWVMKETIFTFIQWIWELRNNVTA